MPYHGFSLHYADGRLAAMIRKVSGDEFRAALAAAAASPAFREQFERLVSFDEWMDESAAVHDGPLQVSGSWSAPALCTLVIGDLTVDGCIDLDNGCDEGGLFVVIGNVSCRHYICQYGGCAVVDGDLVVRDCIVAGCEDSALIVTGKLTTRLFIGSDIWAEVGGGAVMDYGVGYCLPIGYADAVKEAIEPVHDEEDTGRIVTIAPNAAGYLEAPDFAERIRAGRPIFR